MAAPGPCRIVLAVDGPLARSDVPALCERVRRLLEASGADVVLCDVHGLVDSDAFAIELLARLQLTARRVGARVDVCHASERLGELLAFTGLAEACGLRVEAKRQPEERKQPLGVEEEGELDDAPA
jgi:ABC-type transporter Mla MlaB component